MKITKEVLKKLIKEELESLNEGSEFFQSQIATNIFTHSREAGMDAEQVAQALEDLAKRYREAQSTRIPDLGLSKVKYDMKNR